MPKTRTRPSHEPSSVWIPVAEEKPMLIPYSMATLAALAAERIRYLADPPKVARIQLETPFPNGATPTAWAAAIGLGCQPHDLFTGSRFAAPVDIGPYKGADVALVACRKLVTAGVLVAVGGVPTVYRPRATPRPKADR